MSTYSDLNRCSVHSRSWLLTDSNSIAPVRAGSALPALPAALSNSKIKIKCKHIPANVFSRFLVVCQKKADSEMAESGLEAKGSST